MGVPSILAGIITNTGLYTVNLMVMGWSSNVSLLKQDTMFTLFRDLGIGGGFYKMILAGGITMFAGAALVWFLGTRLGLSIRATGDNRDMVRASSVNPVFTITVGLCISNALTALSGAVVGQYQKSAGYQQRSRDRGHRPACLIIGETVLGRRSMGRNVAAAVTGSILYRFLYAMILKTSIVPIECLKLVTAVVVALAIASPSLREWAGLQKKKAGSEEKEGAVMLKLDHIKRPLIRDGQRKGGHPGSVPPPGARGILPRSSAPTAQASPPCSQPLPGALLRIPVPSP